MIHSTSFICWAYGYFEVGVVFIAYSFDAEKASQLGVKYNRLPLCENVILSAC